MSLKSILARQLAAYRAAQVTRITAQPESRQRALLAQLLKRARHTAFGKDHGFAGLQTYDDYQRQVPVRDYEALRPYIERLQAGEPDVLWPGKPLYLAKTSGTTSGTKYIPLTRQAMAAQVRGARDALLLYIHRTGNTAFLNGKMMFLSGSPALEVNAAGLRVGRLSGIAQHFVPSYLLRNRVPTYATNCLEDWEAKVAAIIQETRGQDLRLISGIPPWVRMFLEQAQATTGKTPAQLWPNLIVFIQGGVDYRPYQPLIDQAMDMPAGRVLDTVEVYPASEGFIAVQDQRPLPGATDYPALLLMLDYGIFFEFIPLSQYGQPGAQRLPLWEVQTGVNYAILLSTNAGLWAYDLGDTVKFTSTKPYRLRVTGRVKHFLSAFGEHVIEEEVNAAMRAALQAAGGEVAEFTVAPVVDGPNSCHEWWVEFSQQPEDLARFTQELDTALRARNTYYEDLRAGGMLLPPSLRLLVPNAARSYMQAQGKLGGQNKFPRLSNHRTIADGLVPYLRQP
jgi:GH3 auxin-responsive promoter